MPNKYLKKRKKQVIQSYKDGQPVSEISKELQIPFGTVYRWIMKSVRIAHLPIKLPRILRSCLEINNVLYMRIACLK